MNLVLGACQEGSETLLHGEFGTYPPKGTRYALSLTRTELHIQRLVPKPDTDHRTVVRLIDIVGCHTKRSHTVANSSAFFCVYAYPVKKRKVAVGSSRTRQRMAKTFQVDSAEHYEDNLCVAEKWAVAIKCLVLSVNISSETGKVCPLQDFSSVEPAICIGQALGMCCPLHVVVLDLPASFLLARSQNIC